MIHCIKIILNTNSLKVTHIFVSTLSYEVTKANIAFNSKNDNLLIKMSMYKSQL